MLEEKHETASISKKVVFPFIVLEVYIERDSNVFLINFEQFSITQYINLVFLVKFERAFVRWGL